MLRDQPQPARAARAGRRGVRAGVTDAPRSERRARRAAAARVSRAVERTAAPVRSNRQRALSRLDWARRSTTHAPNRARQLSSASTAARRAARSRGHGESRARACPRDSSSTARAGACGDCRGPGGPGRRVRCRPCGRDHDRTVSSRSGRASSIARFRDETRRRPPHRWASAATGRLRIVRRRLYALIHLLGIALARASSTASAVARRDSLRRVLGSSRFAAAHAGQSRRGYDRITQPIGSGTRPHLQDRTGRRDIRVPTYIACEDGTRVSSE